MSEMDRNEKKEQFVSLDTPYGSGGGSWADEPEPEQQEVAPPAKKSAWGQIAKVEAIDIAKENTRAKNERKKPVVQPKQGGRGEQSEGGRRFPQEERERKPQGDYSGDNSYQRREYGEGGRGERPPRPPKEQQPLPTSPPYTAFVGNLAFSVGEEHLKEFYGELGIVENGIRIVRDQETQRSKGFGYVEFTAQDGLKNALMSDNTEFHGRKLNVDVENKSRRDKKSQWGGSSTSFGGGGGGRSGGGGGGRFGGRGNYGSDRPTERPKINVAPRSVDTAKPPADTATSDSSKPRGEDPFGGQHDYAKMDEAIKKREAAEKDRERRKVEETQARERKIKEERDQKDNKARETKEKEVVKPRSPEQSRERPPTTQNPREQEIDSKSTWRSAPGSKGQAARAQENENRGRGRGRGEEGRGRGRGPRDDTRARGEKGQDYYTGAGRGEKKPPINPHKPSETDKQDAKPRTQQKQETAVSNPFAALSLEGEDNDDDEEENNN